MYRFISTSFAPRLIALVLGLASLLVAVPASAHHASPSLARAIAAYQLLEPCGEIRHRGGSDFWRGEKPMPTQYDEPRAVQIGRYAYLAGGLADINPKTFVATSVDQFLRYDFVKRRYRQLAPMPLRLSHVGITTYNGDVYVVGGLTDDLVTPGATARAFRYITAENRWVEIASLPRPRGALGLVTVGHFMYAIGGVPQGPPGGSQVTAPRSAANEAYDFNTGTWSSRRPIPTARDHLGVAAYNGLIYAVGGRTAQNYARSEFERYDPATDTWASLAPIPVGSSGVQMVAVNGRLVVLSGGDDLVNWVDGRVFSYNPATNYWGQFPAVPTPVHGYAAVEHNGRLHVFGGSKCASFAPITNAESLNVKGGAVVRISRRTARVRNGAARVTLYCGAVEIRCSGRLTLSAGGKVGSKRFRILAGLTGQVKVRVGGRGRSLARSGGRVLATTRATDATGRHSDARARFRLKFG